MILLLSGTWVENESITGQSQALWFSEEVQEDHEDDKWKQAGA